MVAGIKPKYYLKAPEILFDAPIRCLTKRVQTLPIALIVKDAHLFPTLITNLKVHITCNHQTDTIPINLNKNFNSPLEYMLFNIPINNAWHNQFIHFKIEFHYSSDYITKTEFNDNYPNLNKKEYRCFIEADNRLFPEQYYLGDPHYHSSYTSDQVEFGAPLEITKIFAYAMGLDWFFATDHSYDLDDQEDNYLINDLNLSKWRKYSSEINHLSDNSLKIIRGEEVSIGNHKNNNVHLLLINHSEFIPGMGDSGEIWFKNKPTRSIKEIKPEKDSLLIAAHPFEEVPLSQKLTLNRGKWYEKDFSDNHISFLQGINQSEPLKVKHSIHCWVKLLLKGHKICLLAGNDAHGNFQYMKQIKIPYLTLFINSIQIFGQFFSALKYTNNDPINALINKHIIISNGPFIDFDLENEHKYTIGQEINTSEAFLNFLCNSNIEFGKINFIKLFIGDIDKKKEICIINPKLGIKLTLPKKGYARMECSTVNNAMAFTNAIWINRAK